jgi:Flp pilus assembly protein TadD
MEYAALVAQAQAGLAADRLADAEPALREIVRVNPREAFAWAMLGLLQVRRGEPDAAAVAVERALAIDRDNADYLNLMGVVHGERGALDQAVAAFRRALKRRPAHGETHYNLGKALLKRGEPGAAAESFRRAATLAPPYPDAPFMLGLALQSAGRAEDALRVFADLAQRAPDNEDVFLQLGGAFSEARGVDALVAHYRAGQERWRQSGRLHRALGVALLAAGRYEEGWAAYVARDFAGPAPRDPLPGVLPPTLPGRAFLLESEQGLGDVLFFCRFAPRLVARGASVAARVDARLVPLLGRCGAFEAVLAEDDVVPEAIASSERIALGDLPHAVGGEPCAPLALVPDAARVARWRERLAAFGPAPYVGVTWRAGSVDAGREFARDRLALMKEAPLAALGVALRGGSGTLVALQRRPRATDLALLARTAARPVLDATAANDDLEDALALVAALDRYVAVSNTNVHLRAAVGASCDVLVPQPPEWRWMIAGESSPWFPAARLHRQGADRNWAAAFASLRASLANEALSCPAAPRRLP